MLADRVTGSHIVGHRRGPCPRVGEQRRRVTAHAADIGALEQLTPAFGGVLRRATLAERAPLEGEGVHKCSERVEISRQSCVGRPKLGTRQPSLNQAGPRLELPNQGNGFYVFHVYADDRDGHSTLLGSRTIACANATATRPFGAVDRPAQWETVSGRAYASVAWALTPLPKVIPSDGSTITVYIDGVPVGHPTYGQYRSDVATLLPGYNNSNGAVGTLGLDTTKLTNGSHTISWSVTDSAGMAEGIGSRYFTVLNGNSIAGANRHLVEPAGALTLTDQATWGRRIRWRRGYDPNAPLAALDLRNRRINVGELERVEVHLADGSDDRLRYSGHLKVGASRRPLPVGSTLDPRTGVFTWQPGVGYLGSYHLVFERRDRTGRHEGIEVPVTIHTE